MALNIVLLEPEIPQNTGNIARSCAATGAGLHLIGPLGFSIEDKYLKRAGLDYWDKLDISYYNSLDEFFSKHHDKTIYYSSTKASKHMMRYCIPETVSSCSGRKQKACPRRF